MVRSPGLGSAFDVFADRPVILLAGPWESAVHLLIPFVTDLLGSVQFCFGSGYLIEAFAHWSLNGGYRLEAPGSVESRPSPG